MTAQTQAVTTFDLTPANLKELGLQESDIAQVGEVAKRIESGNPTSVAEFGRDVADHTSHYADTLLEQVNNRDLDDAGAKLTEVVNVARELNVGPLSDNRSRIPVIGPIIDKVRMRTSRMVGRFETTREQIDTLIGEVQTTQRNMRERNEGLHDTFEAVREEHRLLGVHIAAGRVRLGELNQEVETLRGEVGNDPTQVQRLADLEAVVANLDKRIGDLRALQTSAMQSLPMIRMIQANNQTLVDKFHTIQTITIPAWKRQFMLALSLNEQKNAVEMANNIDNTTNDLLKRNADLLHRNSVATAKANQRLVIDVDTLKQVQDTLIKTVDDVRRTHEEGVRQRQDAEKRLTAMRRDLQHRLSHASNDTPAARKGDVA